MGGPAGTMEGGRQAEVAKAILAAKNVPYVVAAPLLIQVQLSVLPAIHCTWTSKMNKSQSLYLPCD